MLKALAKQPAQRYATIAEFADDLRRHLHGQTVHARPSVVGYRARKFVVRNRVAVGAAAAIGVALVGGTVVSLWQAQIARQEAARAEAVKQFVLSLFDSANTDNGAKPDTTALQLLEQARERLDAAAITDPAIRIELLTTIGWALQGFNEFRKAEPLLADAAHLAAALPEDRNSNPAWAIATYGLALARRGALAEAAQQLDAAEERMRRIGDLAGVAFVLRGKGELHAREGDYETAIDLMRRSARAAENLPARNAREELLISAVYLADVTRQAQFPGELELARRALSLAQEIHGSDITPTVLEAKRNYALALADEGSPAKALSQLAQVHRLQADKLGPGHTQIARTLRHLAEVSLMLGDPASAIVKTRESVRICEIRSGGVPTPQLARAKLGAGDVYANARRYDAALLEWRDANALYSALYGADNELARLARSGMALALTMQGQLETADSMFAALQGKAFSNERGGIFKRRLARLRSAQGRHDEALALLRDSLGSAAASSQWPRALTLADLGNALVLSGKFEEALSVLQQARTVLLRTQTSGSPDLAGIAIDIGRAQLALGHAGEAVAATQEAATYWSQFAPDHRHAGIALLWQVRALIAAGDANTASQILPQARDILSIAGSPGDRTLLEQTHDDLRAMHSAANTG